MIEFMNVSKRFGTVQALNQLNLQFGQGKIIGLFGPNGAGKSTTMKMIAGLNQPDNGSVLIDGKRPRQVRASIAYLPEIDHLYGWLTLQQDADFSPLARRDWTCLRLMIPEKDFQDMGRFFPPIPEQVAAVDAVCEIGAAAF